MAARMTPEDRRAAAVKRIREIVASAPREEPPDSSEEYQLLLDYTPPRLVFESVDPLEPQTSPLDLYDLHINEGLQLKRVVLLPSLVMDIATRIQKVRTSLESRGLGPLPFNDHTVRGGDWYTSGDRENAGAYPRVNSAESVGRLYERMVAASCMPLASQWILHPKYETYGNILQYDEGKDTSLPDHPFVMDKLSLRIQLPTRTSADILRTLERRAKLDIKYLEGKNLATWVFLRLSTDGESALADMGSLCENLCSMVPTTAGHHTPRSREEPIPPDAHQPLLVLPDTDYRPQNTGSASPKLTRIYPNGRHSQASLKRGLPRPVSANDVIQHGWTNAVRHDNTFIIFSTGNQERIGVRHRESQTLYLSDLINVPSPSIPPYGQLQTGLFLTILEDALDRLRGVKGRPSQAHTLGKRTRVSNDFLNVRRSKRNKIGALASQMNTSTAKFNEMSILKEIDAKFLALVSIETGVFNSPVPAAFARAQPCLSVAGIGKAHPENQRDYLPSEAIQLVLGPCFAEGAIGKLHTATLVANPGDSASPQVDVIVKVAITRQHRRRLRREYTMYRHLWKQKVPGILPIYGLFEDYNNLATLLVMGKGGISLWERECDRHGVDKHQVQVLPREREMFIDILRGIHKAGVCHRDIHPGNLIIDTNGNGYFIDFDRARANRSLADHALEMKNLRNLLDGKWSLQGIPMSSCPSLPS